MLSDAYAFTLTKKSPFLSLSASSITSCFNFCSCLRPPAAAPPRPGFSALRHSWSELTFGWRRMLSNFLKPELVRRALIRRSTGLYLWRRMVGTGRGGGFSLRGKRCHICNIYQYSQAELVHHVFDSLAHGGPLPLCKEAKAGDVRMLFQPLEDSGLLHPVKCGNGGVA